MNNHYEQDFLTLRLKHLVADLFRLDIAEPDTISDHAPLLGGDLGLDSFDAVELALCIEEEFGLNLHGREDSFRAFISISSLASFIRSHAQAGSAQPHNLSDTRVLSQALTAFAQG